MDHPIALKSALFVDFDNVYSSLRSNEAEAAELFASGPERWLRWLETEVPADYVELPQGVVRRVLVRRCYINPRAFGRYRSYFIRAGFEVVDCPPLTSQGKTSADIHMVIDILDSLNGPVRFDEFVILSADADFTPVLLRLRRNDRRTCVLAFGAASPAYKAAADRLLDENAFLDGGLGMEDALAPSSRPVEIHKASRALLARIGERVLAAADIQGSLRAVDLPHVYKDFPEFRSTGDWLGFGSLRAMTEAVVECAGALEIVEEDPWVVRRKKVEPKAAAGKPLPSEADLAEWISRQVRESNRPIPLATLAQRMADSFEVDVHESGWPGKVSFKQLLDGLDLGGASVSSRVPGFVYDPARHELPEPEEEAVLSDVLERVCRITELPRLSSEQYALLFREIAKEVAENGYHLSRTSRNLRDRLNERGVPMGRAVVSFVLKGLVYSGYALLEGAPLDPGEMAEAFAKNALFLCEQSQLDLSPAEEEAVRDWLAGAVQAEV